MIEGILIGLFVAVWYYRAQALKESARKQDAETRAAEAYADEHDGWGPYVKPHHRKLVDNAAPFNPEAAAHQRDLNR